MHRLEQPVTRAEFAVLVVKYSRAEPIQEDTGFKDVAKQDWYYSYVAVVKEKGFMSGIF
ncbi:S-layer homology domain-containing protein [Paenibacillus sp. FSL H8-0548]|uniref:S-layer homology domain-containing protein n=1 Tax=Paenibacillus sp. FSL H8-0548 TaxID=1920422 RepID=UPI0009FAF97D